MHWLENNDPAFWSYGEDAVCYWRDHLNVIQSFLDPLHRDGAFVCYLDKGWGFPPFLAPVFKHQLSGYAVCVKCASPFTDVRMRTIPHTEYTIRRLQEFVACDCGYPVWRLDKDRWYMFTEALTRAIKNWNRTQSIRTAGGIHTSEEIKTILRLQENRCFYCNVSFSADVQPTKDHLLAITDGGTDWALNIVLACRACNSRRGNIPFRTYCTLLSPTQNLKILLQLVKRFTATGQAEAPEDATKSFARALALHDPEHSRYLDIKKLSAAARRNVLLNELFPKTPRLLIKQYQSLQRGASA